MTSTTDKEKLAAVEQKLQDPEFSDALLKHSLETFESCLQSAFNERRDIFVFEIVKKLRREKLAGPQTTATESGDGGWVDIESLSRLRNVVGRIENIKKKWIGAGFPLREHRGDKAGSFEVNSEGWVELSNWMSKHGYESRLRPDRPECLFQIKPLQKNR
jgi:hypothetical protein